MNRPVFEVRIVVGCFLAVCYGSRILESKSPGELPVKDFISTPFYSSPIASFSNASLTFLKLNFRHPEKDLAELVTLADTFDRPRGVLIRFPKMRPATDDLAKALTGSFDFILIVREQRHNVGFQATQVYRTKAHDPGSIIPHYETNLFDPKYEGKFPNITRVDITPDPNPFLDPVTVGFYTTLVVSNVATSAVKVVLGADRLVNHLKHSTILTKAVQLLVLEICSGILGTLRIVNRIGTNSPGISLGLDYYSLFGLYNIVVTSGMQSGMVFLGLCSSYILAVTFREVVEHSGSKSSFFRGKWTYFLLFPLMLALVLPLFIFYKMAKWENTVKAYVNVLTMANLLLIQCIFIGLFYHAKSQAISVFKQKEGIARMARFMYYSAVASALYIIAFLVALGCGLVFRSKPLVIAVGFTGIWGNIAGICHVLSLHRHNYSGG